MENESKYYGVSSGNGNDGVSQMFPDYIVKTSEPWRLARLAAISTFKQGYGRKWAKKHMYIDGDAEYTISATFLEVPRGETHFGAAWLIFEVFPADEELLQRWQDDPYKIVYESLAECFGRQLVAANRE